MRDVDTDGRLTLRADLPPGTLRARFARDVAAGLAQTPKRLPCCYFYDDEGSRLFEAICGLPEYYLPRAEREILETHADELAGRFPARPLLVELGSGSASKTRLLIEALLRRYGTAEYMPIDISQGALVDSARAFLAAYPALRIRAVAGDYFETLRDPAIPSPGPKLILWLGSSIGNLDRPDAAAFLRKIAPALGDAGRILVGIDLRKARAVLEPAYDDAQGVTARFNLNVLARINRELDGAFDLSAFRHRAVYNEGAGRIEMYLVSVREQTVAIGQLGMTVRFAADEALLTEYSYKYRASEIDTLAESAGLAIDAQWHDTDRRFSVTLFTPRR
ncbi:MAG TPA: L-histidine N(alpha)-methyltransferase [bacterium]|nr:L-histidine N(alpha)-methyltransferase [bacterium]